MADLKISKARQYLPNTAPRNVDTKFREAFESYEPNGSRWAETKGTGDLVFLDGTDAAAGSTVVTLRTF